MRKKWGWVSNTQAVRGRVRRTCGATHLFLRALEVQAQSPTLLVCIHTDYSLLHIEAAQWWEKRSVSKHSCVLHTHKHTYTHTYTHTLAHNTHTHTQHTHIHTLTHTHTDLPVSILAHLTSLSSSPTENKHSSVASIFASEGFCK